MRIFTYLLGILFVLFILVQLNDPDPVLWVIIYLVPAVISILLTHLKVNGYVLLMLSVFYLIAAIYLFPPSISDWINAEEKSQSLGMKLPGIEEARESMGLFICFLTLLFFWIKSIKP